MDDQLLRCIATISGRYAGRSGRPSREHRTALRVTEPLWLLAEVIWREVARNRCTTRWASPAYTVPTPHAGWLDASRRLIRRLWVRLHSGRSKCERPGANH